jgi:hypothetical protein
LGRVVAVATTNASSSSVIRRMTCRIESSSAATRRAIAGTVFPPAEASTTIARRSRTADPVPLRVIRSNC